MVITREETFGPVAPLYRFKTDDEAIKMANDTEFGLAAYFYSRDIGRIWRVAEGLEYGIVGINEGIISTETGKLLMQQCAGTVKKLSLELGGNAPFIVFDDADIEMAVKGAIASKYRNAGQTCVCANRILVQDGVYDAFTKRLAETAGAMKVADGFEPGAVIRSLIT